MKNYTLKSLYLTMMVLLALAPKNAEAQCVAPTSGGTINPTSTFQQILTTSGRYYTFTATAGCTYLFSHCQGGGNAPIGTDPILTLTDAANTVITFNNDAGGICGGSAGSQITWTPSVSGTYRIHHCAATVQNATMAYRVQCPCNAGVALASPNVRCFGQSTTLTVTGQSAGSSIQWQSSPNNTTYTDVPGGITSPYVYTPLNTTTWFRAIITCDGVTGNAVGADTTDPVQVTVNALPVLTFQAASGGLCCNSAPINFVVTPTGGSFSSGGNGVSGNQFIPSQACGVTTTVTYTYTDPTTQCTNTINQNFTVNDTPTITWPAITGQYCSNICNPFPIPAASPSGGVYGPAPFVNNLNGTFVPCQAPVGQNPAEITYVYSNPVTGCGSQVKNYVTINQPPAVDLPDFPDLCVNSTLQLNGTPGGGTYTDANGTDVTTTGLYTATNNVPNTITYIYTDPNTGCSGADDIQVQGIAYPNVSFAGAFPTLCNNGTPLNLNGFGTPGGGTWSTSGADFPTSSVNNPTVNFFNPTGLTGTGWIIYTVANGACADVDSQQLTVVAAPAVNTQNLPVPEVCVGSAPFLLTNYVTPAGGTWAMTPNVPLMLNTLTGQFTPSQAGVYTITYTVTQLPCQNSITFQVVVNPLPVMNVVHDLGDICQNAVSVQLPANNPPGGVYTGTGVTGSGPYFFNPQQPVGGYTLTYTYTNPTTGCSNSDTSHIDVVAPPTLVFPPLADVCDESALVLLQATPAGGTFSNPNFGYVTPGPGIQYFDPVNAPVGNHIITYIYTDVLTGCGDTTTQNIIVKPIPGNLTICGSTNPTTCGAASGSFCICGLLPNTSYTLDYYRNGTYFGPFNIVTNGTGQYCRTNLIAGVYDQIYVYRNGCPQVTPLSVTITDPNAPAAPTAGSNSPVCQFATIQLTATSGVANGAYTWSGPISYASNQQNATRVNAQPGHSGVYSVTVTNPANNCTSVPGTVNVVVNPAPQLTLSSNSPVCQGNTLNLNASSTTPNTTFFWQGPNTYTSAQANPSISNVTSLNAGWYKVTVTNNTTGCQRTDSVLVVVGTVIPLAPSANGNTPVCSGQTLNLTASNSTAGATYIWGGPTGFVANVQNPTRPNITIADEGLYYVRATLNGCESDTNSVWIDVIQSLTPTITISATPDDTVCFGTNIEFTSVITDGGTNPQYQWYINGIPVIGAIDSFWGTPYLTDLDTVTAVLINATTCTTASADTSNKIAIHMAPNTIPTVLISSDPIVWVAGQTMTYNAFPLNAGTNPTFQWYLNGTLLAGETNQSFVSSTLTDQDILSVTVTSDAPCAIPDTATDDWNAITALSVNVGGKTIDNMQLFPNPNDGTFILTGNFNGMTGVKTIQLEVTNAVGQVVYRENVMVHNGKLDKQIKATDMASGVYMLRISGEGYATQMKFVVRK